MGEQIQGTRSLPDEYMSIARSVLDRIRPDVEEMKRIGKIVDSVISRSRSLQREIKIDFDMVHVGSTSKGTNLRKGDIAIFYTFHPSVRGRCSMISSFPWESASSLR